MRRTHAQGDVQLPDVHLPHLENEEEDGPGPSPQAHARPLPGGAVHRSKSLLRIGLEVILISTGVFLGLMGEQWRELAQHRELAEASLRRFRAEILTNRKAVSGVKDYHVATKKSLDTYFASDARTRQTVDVSLHGLQPAFFEHTAWDLALVTQSLAYTDPRLAVALSRIYTVQQEYAELSRGITQAMYLRTPTENLDGFLGAVALYYSDIVLIEPKLVGMYDEVLPQIDRALGESSAEKSASK
jgi:hypothetical protein